MRRKVSIVVLILGLLMVLFFTVAQAKSYEIAVVVKIAGIPWFNRMAEGVKKAAKELLKLPKDTKTRIDYRVIADINLKEKRIEVTKIGHRKNIYKKD